MAWLNYDVDSFTTDCLFCLVYPTFSLLFSFFFASLESKIGIWAWGFEECPYLYIHIYIPPFTRAKRMRLESCFHLFVLGPSMRYPPPFPFFLTRYWFSRQAGVMQSRSTFIDSASAVNTNVHQYVTCGTRWHAFIQNIIGNQIFAGCTCMLIWLKNMRLLQSHVRATSPS